MAADSALAPTAPDVFWTKVRRRRYALYAAAAVVLGGYASIADWRDRHAFLINATTSLPNWAFVLETKRAPARGELVFFNPPRSALLQRHFGEHPLFGKIAYGVGGDVVTRDGRAFFVNGRRVAIAKVTSRFGEPLALGPNGTIPAGCFFVGSPHKDGFDSRYGAIGWICQRSIVGVGSPIL